MTCIDRDCSICGGKGLIKGDGIHEFDVSVENIPCISRTCTLCHGNIAPSENHKDSEPSKTCIDRPCSICGTEDVFEHSSDHTPSENETDMACISRICHICGEFVIEATEGHAFEDMDATCTDRECLVCSGTFEHTTDHVYELDENDDSVCTLCGEVLEKEGEDHVSVSYVAIAMVTVLAGSLLLIGRGGL